MSEEVKTEEEVELSELEQIEAEIAALTDEDAPIEDVVAEVTEEETTSEEQEEEAAENKSEEEDVQKSTEESETEKEPKEEVAPDNAAFARLRHEKKQMAERIAELEKKPEQDGSAEDSVSKLKKIWESGEGDDKSHLANVRKASSKELAAIYQKAVDGEYGDHSEDVIKTVSEAMPMVQAREKQAGEKAQTRQDAVMKDYEAEAKQAKADYPDYADGESEASKAKITFDKEMLGSMDPETGELDGTGALPEELANYIISHPYVQHQLAHKVYKDSLKNSDSSKSTMAVLTKERDNLKAQLSKYVTLETPSGAKQTSVTSNGETAADIEKQIFGLNA